MLQLAPQKVLGFYGFPLMTMVKGANAPVGFGRDRTLILRGCIEITWGRHRASVHWHPLNKSYAIAAARSEPR
jgi:hypothetical protein